MVSLEWYRTFKAVYETGSLTAAAKKLFISQPNVSQHISALETHVGKTLFERKYKVVPTEFAKIIYNQIIEPLDKLEAVDATFKRVCLGKNRPAINIGFPMEYVYLLGKENINTLNAMVISIIGSPEVLQKKLENGEIDFMLTTDKLQNKKMTSEVVLKDDLILVGSHSVDTRLFDGFIQAKDNENIKDWLLQQNWYAYDYQLGNIKNFWTEHFRKNPLIVPQAVIPDMQTLLQGISKGNAISVMSRSLVDCWISEGKIKVIWEGYTPISQPLYLAYNPGTTSTFLIDKAKDLLLK